jgi:uncharacterized protein (UPF0210 family)
MPDYASAGFRPAISRRDFFAAAGAASLLPLVATVPGALFSRDDSPRLLRVRAITAGVTLRSLAELGHAETALAMLGRAKRRFVEAGFEVQTVRVATTPLLAHFGAAARASSLDDLRALDRLAQDAGAVLSVGPVLTRNEPDPELAAWVAEAMRATEVTSYSAVVASPALGVHAKATRTAADIVVALSRVTPDGKANFRFAAAANVPAGTPFFPVAHHEGADAISIGMETPRLLRAAVGDARDPAAAQQRMRETLTKELAPVERLMKRFAGEEKRRYLGIDTSPAPGPDSSIAEVIEAITGVPFGAPSTLNACAAVTAAVKSLEVTTCGYSGLMLPVLEDPPLARRAAEGRFGIQELLLYSSVCGTGLDVVPVPGDVAPEDLERVFRDVATLSDRLRKPLSARLFPIPGKTAGETVEFDDPFLTDSVVLPIG